jgi:phospholipid transport system substrate-binding protein
MHILYRPTLSRRVHNSQAAWALTALLLLTFTHAIVLGAAEEQAEIPTEAVRATLTEVFHILEDPELKDPAQQARRRNMLEETIARRFDYREMSKRTLGSYWSRLTDTERTEFVDVFKGFLSDRYAGKIEGYTGEKVQYLSERLEGQFAEVRTKLVSSKVEIPMDYRLINKEGRWYAYDIVADGVSLVKNYRSQFEKILKTGSYEELVSRLKDHSVSEAPKGKRSSFLGPKSLPSLTHGGEALSNN